MTPRTCATCNEPITAKHDLVVVCSEDVAIIDMFTARPREIVIPRPDSYYHERCVPAEWGGDCDEEESQ